MDSVDNTRNDDTLPGLIMSSSLLFSNSTDRKQEKNSPSLSSF